MGVQRPNSRSIPIQPVSTQSTVCPIEFALGRSVQPSRIIPVPATIRSKRSPNAGAPLAKVENTRRTMKWLGGTIVVGLITVVLDFLSNHFNLVKP